MMTAPDRLTSLSMTRERGQSVALTFPNGEEVLVTIPSKGKTYHLQVFPAIKIEMLKAHRISFNVSGTGRRVRLNIVCPASIKIRRVD
jgi:hypothetical protein